MNKWISILKNIGTGKLLLILFAGILLIIAPSFEEKESTKNTKSSAEAENIKKQQENENYNSDSGKYYSNEEMLTQYEKRFEEILMCIPGVTDVKVMITFESSGGKVVLKEVTKESDSVNETDSYGGIRISSTEKTEETVIYNEDCEGNSTPYVTEINAPVIKGVLIVAKGAQKSEVALAISEAATALFGIEAHRVKVLPME